MVTRYFVKDKDLIDTLHSIGNTNVDWAVQPMTVYVDGWETLSILQKTDITAACTALNYIFDHDA